MKTNIGVFFGGKSTEHEISIISANQAINAINRDKYDITPVYITKEGRMLTVFVHKIREKQMKGICE